MSSVLNYCRAISFLAFLIVDHSEALPIPNGDPHASQTRAHSKLNKFSQNHIQYLSQFGYLETTDSQSLTSVQQLEDAIRNLQFTGRLNVTGVLDDATLTLMAKPRCGVPDVAITGFRNKRHAIGDPEGHPSVRVKRYNLQGERWAKPNLTWSLKNVPKTSGLDRIAVESEIQNALEMWSRETRLSFTKHQPQEAADIEIFFVSKRHGDGYPFDGSGSVLAHAFFPGSGRGGDVHFDDDENWSRERVINREITSVFAVAVHELGHSLGLSHSSVEGSLMFPWYSGVPDHRALPDDDLKAIRHLYGDPLDVVNTRYHITKGQDSIPKTNSTSQTSSPNGAQDRNETLVPHPSAPVIPDKCDTDFDAVAMIRSEMWVFKGRYFWRIDKNGGTRDDPIHLSSFWYGLPDTIDHVDAVYERPDHKIVFFIGNIFYLLTGNSLLESGPLPITQLGLPANLTHIDGAMVWGWNDKTYFFSGYQYWSFDENIQHVELDYPRNISTWGGVPYPIDAVFQHTNKMTYFFKGKMFWQFDDIRMQVSKPEDPNFISQVWMRCPREIQDPFKSSSLDKSRGRLQNFPCPLLVLSLIAFHTKSWI